MNPKDRTGKLRHRVRELLGSDHPTGKQLGDQDLEEIITALEDN